MNTIYSRICVNILINRRFMAKQSKMFSLNKSQKPNANNSKNLLAASPPLKIPIRTMSDANVSNKSPTISMESPLGDYKKLMDNMMESNQEDEEQMDTYRGIAAEARKTVWKLLFEQPSPDNEKKAGELLKEHKMDACFYEPWDYNDWIVGVRDELLKRQMLDFWRNIMVKQSLGPCWARDSDYFDDMNDPEPAKFYRHAGAVAPWEATTTTTTTENKASNVQSDNSILPSAPNAQAGSSELKIPTASDLKISLEDPVKDYTQHVETYLMQDVQMEDYDIERIYKAVAESARKAIWSLLFDNPQPPTEDRQKKAGDLLHQHKADACFHTPYCYNEWIVKLRDEVLKRGLLQFWRNQMVERSLGLCWARDCDFYDDMEDPKPAEFYAHAGCVAPWLKE